MSQHEVNKLVAITVSRLTAAVLAKDPTGARLKLAGALLAARQVIISGDERAVAVVQQATKNAEAIFSQRGWA